MDVAPATYPYLSSRFIDYKSLTYYYAYGNTPAEDLLGHVNSENEKEPTILSLGCGDIRSCFYTIWKHFDSSSGGHNFHGAQFVLNDLSAAVLARNILFLFLALKIPPWKECEKAKQWIASMWAIWYCHELLPAHEQMLKEALATLLSFSDSIESWESSAQAISQIVSYTESSTLMAINNIWKLWYTKSFRLGRSSKLEYTWFHRSFPGGIHAWLKKVGLHKFTTERILYAMRTEMSSFAVNGSVYAEDCLNLPYSSDYKVVNPTLFEREDKYTLHYASNPYVCYYHGFVFCKSEIEKLGTEVSICGSALIVEDDSFLNRPLLSNSVQQFSMWVSSSAATLSAQISNPKQDVTFFFNCSDCVKCLEQLQIMVFKNLPSSFDCIFSSNLIDRLPPPILVLAAKPLLKPASYLITASIFFKDAYPSTVEYLKDLFGVAPELLPLLCGIRCVGRDGIYADPIISFPVLSDNFVRSRLLSCEDQVFFWQRLDSQPLIVDSLLRSNLHCLLFEVIKAQIMYFYGSDPQTIRTAMCTETAINTILSFVSQLDADVDINKFSFWDDLCFLVRNEAALRPFLVHIQTQALLHGLHFHLTLNEINCPVCNKKSLDEFINRFSIEFDPLGMNPLCMDQGVTPEFIIFIHKIPINSRILSNDNLLSNDHIIDSAQSLEAADGNLKLDFFFPTLFKDNYCTVVRYVTKSDETPVAFLSCKLRQLKVSFLQEPLFHFKQAGAYCTKTLSTSLGHVLSHFGDSDSMKTTFSFAPNPLSLLSSKSTGISIRQPSPMEIQIICAEHTFIIRYPYPIDCQKIKTRMSLNMVILAPRKKCNFYDEQSTFISVNDYLSLPTLPSSVLQFTMHEDKCVKRSPVYNLKFLIENFLTLNKMVFKFFEDDPDLDRPPSLCILIHRRAYDVAKYTPVLDVYYFFCENNSQEIVCKFSAMLQEIDPDSQVTRPVDNSWHLLKSYLQQSANHTTNTQSHPPTILRKHGLEKYFTRAILYPLYYDQEAASYVGKYSTAMSLTDHTQTTADKSLSISSASLSTTATTSSSHREPKSCNYCSCKSDNLKKCTRCGKAWYCGKQCQTNDWKKHKEVCKQPKCSSCGKVTANLKRCSACHLVAYCTKECQRNDWIRHKLSCINTQQ